MRFILVVLLMLLIVLLVDFVRSLVVIARLYHSFYKHYVPQPELYTLGRGKDYHVVLLGDSGIDGHASNQIKFGPAQALIEELAEQYRVTVHIFAKEGSKSYDVVAKQLPRLEALPQVDLIFIYMGANNIIRGKSPARVKADFTEIINYAQQRSITVIASELAEYWRLTMFSVIPRFIIYILNTSCNRQLRELTKQYKNFILVGIPGLTKRFLTPEYMADRLHPNDRALRVWSEVILEEVKTTHAEVMGDAQAAS